MKKTRFLDIPLGFTLVELMVVISLIGILSALGLASYINFSRSQLVLQSARKIVQDLRLAQSLAVNQQKPAGCGALGGYIFAVSGNNYSISADCSDLLPAQTLVKEGSIPENLELAGFSQVKFRVLRRGIEFSGGSTLEVSGFDIKKTIRVSEGGVIKVEGEVESE